MPHVQSELPSGPTAGGACPSCTDRPGLTDRYRVGRHFRYLWRSAAFFIHRSITGHRRVERGIDGEWTSVSGVASRNDTAGKAGTASGAGLPRKTGRPFLGERVVVKAALDRSELAVVDLLCGNLERSAFLGVLLTEHVGRPDLLPRPEQLSLVNDALSAAAVQRLLAEVSGQPEMSTPRRRLRRRKPDATVRIHPDVRHEIECRRQRAGVAQCHYNADVIRERLGIEPRAGRTEALPLAL